MSAPDLFLPAPLRDEVAAYLEPRAAAVDRGDLDVREGLAYVQSRVCDERARHPNGDLLGVAQLIGTAAWSDLASAFSLWCHRMVLEYVDLAPEDLPSRRELLPRLARMDVIGSTGLAPAMAHVVSGTPLPVAARPEGSGLVLDGKIPWASNLFTPGFVLVTAASGQDGGRVVVLTGGSEGLRVAPYPELVALQATASSSLALEGVHVEDDAVIARDLRPFVSRVRPAFLILQASFCWGLARRCLDEAGRRVGSGHVLGTGVTQLEDRTAALAAALAAAAGDARERATPLRSLVALRLEAQCVASDAAALELRAAGSAAYLRASPTARRLREAAFLPIQAPTEVQLRSELDRTFGMA